MGHYEFLEHTADEKFRVTAKSLDDAFATSVKAFYEILIGKQHVKRVESQDITCSAKKLTTLLYDFLNELVFCFDDADVILPHVEGLAIDKDEDADEYVLTATLVGDKHYDYDLRTEIKNMTYSEMEVKQLDNGYWEFVVVVDI
ncbi:archease [Candidatus Woesearchaeota archaeon]|nr:archease [Candidatus Woesearchaeota archaeon]